MEKMPINKINLYFFFSGGNLHVCVHCQIASIHIASMEANLLEAMWPETVTYTLYIALFILYSIQSIVCSVQYTIYTVHCALANVHLTVWPAGKWAMRAVSKRVRNYLQDERHQGGAGNLQFCTVNNIHACILHTKDYRLQGCSVYSHCKPFLNY